MAHTDGMRFCGCSIGLPSPNTKWGFSFDQTSNMIRVEIVVEAFLNALACTNAMII